ncbi:MAG: diguanylate cyclase domain-containing protein, partial [Aquincola tertiaricarbonis]
LPATRRGGAEAAVLLCEGVAQEARGDSRRALALFDRAVSTAAAGGDDELMADALFQRAYLRGVQGELAAGLTDMRRAMSLYEKLQQPQQAQNALSGIAILYNRMGDHAQARHYFEASLKLQRASGMSREELVTLHNLGRTLEGMADWPAAHKAFEEALHLARRIHYPRGEAYALRGLASVRNARQAPSEALALLDLASQIQQDTPDERLRGQFLLQRGIALRQLHRPAEAVELLQQAMEIFRRADSLAEQVAAGGELAAALKDSGDWRAAFTHHAAFKEASDTLLRRQLDQRFATLKIEFDSAAKDKENALLQREKSAADAALAQERRVGRLKLVVMLLATALVVVLAALAWRQRRSGRTMQKLAMTDELTALPNRRHVLARLEALLAPGAGGGALLIVDLDHFKRFNDERGHLIGDEVLRAVADVLRQAVRPPAAVGRLGGEEFVVVLPRADVMRAAEVAEDLRRRVQAIDAAPWSLGSGTEITTSVGLTLAEPGDDLSTMLRRADEALYAAKAAGRNRVVVRTKVTEAQDGQQADAVIGAARQALRLPLASADADSHSRG